MNFEKFLLSKMKLNPSGRMRGGNEHTFRSCHCIQCCRPAVIDNNCESQKLDKEVFGSFIVHAIGISIFLLFFMITFWIRILMFLIKSGQSLANANRTTQTGVGVLAAFFMCSIIYHGVTGHYRMKNTKLNNEKDTDQLSPFNMRGLDEPQPLRIELQTPYLYDDLSSLKTKIFTLTITDEKKNIVYKTITKFSFPAHDNPAIIISMDPILITKY